MHLKINRTPEQPKEPKEPKVDPLVMMAGELDAIYGQLNIEVVPVLEKMINNGIEQGEAFFTLYHGVKTRRVLPDMLYVEGWVEV